MFSTVSVFDRTVPVLTVLAFSAGCFGGSQDFSASSASPEPGQHAVVPSDQPSQPDHPVDDVNVAETHEAVSDDHGSIHWSYTGIGGPSHWGSLSPEYNACSDGTRQSPIDLSASRGRDLSGIVFGYRPTNLAIVNNGHTIQVDHYGDSYISVGRWPYRLRQFHFHSPSEHTIDGEYAEIEMHLVHQDDRGRLAVVGIMIESGEYNAAFEDAWNHLPGEAGDPKIIEDAFVDPESLLPTDRNFFHYSGSLTTPPCSEGVSWFVMTNPIQMSPEQIIQFQEIIDGNNRPIQERKGRALYSTSNQ